MDFTILEAVCTACKIVSTI